MDDEHSPRSRSVSFEVVEHVATIELTAAERDVLARIATGASNAQIAAARGVSVRTVANQVAHLFKKLGAGSRYELMQWRDGKRMVIACRDRVATLDALTAEEREVVFLVAQAMPFKLIAYELDLAIGTVAGRLRRAMRKLRVSSRIELLQRLGLGDRT